MEASNPPSRSAVQWRFQRWNRAGSFLRSSNIRGGKKLCFRFAYRAEGCLKFVGIDGKIRAQFRVSLVKFSARKRRLISPGRTRIGGTVTKRPDHGGLLGAEFKRLTYENHVTDNRPKPTSVSNPRWFADAKAQGRAGNMYRIDFER
jgi:hypothetical protein